MKTKFGCATLQKDDDPSHESKSTWNYTWRYKRQHEVLDHILTYLDQSSDLNCQEASWNILKRYVRHYSWTSTRATNAYIANGVVGNTAMGNSKTL